MKIPFLLPNMVHGRKEDWENPMVEMSSVFGNV